MRTIRDVAHGRNNNFNLLRMAAASAVLFSHSYPLSLGLDATQPLEWTRMTLGTIAVIVFFGLSGFFIAKSFDRSRSVVEFASARILRVMPALAVSVPVSAYCLGVALTTTPFNAYVFDHDTTRFVTDALSFRNRTGALPGLFTDNPLPLAVNGSLWTLRFEVICYAIALGFGLIMMLKCSRVAIAVAFIAIAAIYCAVRIRSGLFIPDVGLMRVAPPFLAGMAIYHYRGIVPASLPLAVVLAAITCLSFDLPFYFELSCLSLTYGALVMGYAGGGPLLRYNAIGDYSYGMYVYAFPIQQTIADLVPGVTPFPMAAGTFVVTLALAVVSWHAIEKPALAAKKHVEALHRKAMLRYRDGLRSI